MKNALRGTLLAALILSDAQHLRGQGSPEPPVPSTAPATNHSDQPKIWFKHFSLGFRVRGFTTELFDPGDHQPNVEDTKAQTTTTSTTTSTSGKWAIGPKLEIPLFRGLSITGEAYYAHMKYQKESLVYKGINNVTSSTLLKTITERTKAAYWDFPVLLQYRGLIPRAICRTSSSPRG